MLGVPQGISPFGVPQGISPFGVPQGISPFGVPLAPIPGVVPPPAPIPSVGMPPGTSPFGVPSAPIPGAIHPLHPSSAATAFLLGQIALREAATRLGDEALKGRVITDANQAIARAIDDLAGVTLHPWFKAVALSWVYPTVTDLAVLAYTVAEGALRTELLNVAGELLRKGLTPSGEGTGRGG
jgi:hypothetical protein